MDFLVFFDSVRKLIQSRSLFSFNSYILIHIFKAQSISIHVCGPLHSLVSKSYYSFNTPHYDRLTLAPFPWFIIKRVEDKLVIIWITRKKSLKDHSLTLKQPPQNDPVSSIKKLNFHRFGCHPSYNLFFSISKPDFISHFAIYGSDSLS